MLAVRDGVGESVFPCQEAEGAAQCLRLQLGGLPAVSWRGGPKRV